MNSTPDTLSSLWKEWMNEYLYLSINFQVTTSTLFAKIYTTRHFNWLFVKSNFRIVRKSEKLKMVYRQPAVARLSVSPSECVCVCTMLLLLLLCCVPRFISPFHFITFEASEEVAAKWSETELIIFFAVWCTQHQKMCAALGVMDENDWRTCYELSCVELNCCRYAR